MNTRSKIIEALNAQNAIDAGLSNGDAHVRDDDLIGFTYPAPVISGACCGHIEVYRDGRIHDDTSDQEFVNFDQWLADLNSMMEG